MICPTCHGTGRGPNDGTYLYASINLRVDIRGTCPECRGSGISSCCDTAGAGIAEGGSAEKDERDDRSD